MKSFVFNLIVCVSFLPVFGMEKYGSECTYQTSVMDGIVYRLAVPDDMPRLMELVTNFDATDRHNLLVLPVREQQESSFSQAIAKGRLFVALNEAGKILAYKKLYVVTEKGELEDITQNELRCATYEGSYREPVDGIATLRIEELDATYAVHAQYDSSLILPSLSGSIAIYTGSDYTMHEYRGREINSRLTRFALRNILATISTDAIESVCLMYGVVEALSGPYIEDGRTGSIAHVFAQEMRRVFGSSVALEDDHDGQSSEDTCLLCARFKSYKPIFSESGNLLTRINEETGSLFEGAVGVAGFGYLLFYLITKIA